jgi:hypothetical protein
MPNGKPGDHPLTDIVIHGRRVYSEAADTLVRAIVKLTSREERDRLADLLFQEYNDVDNPHVAELELRLTAMLAELEASARTRGWKPS